MSLQVQNPPDDRIPHSMYCDRFLLGSTSTLERVHHFWSQGCNTFCACLSLVENRTLSIWARAVTSLYDCLSPYRSLVVRTSSPWCQREFKQGGKFQVSAGGDNVPKPYQTEASAHLLHL